MNSLESLALRLRQAMVSRLADAAERSSCDPPLKEQLFAAFHRRPDLLAVLSRIPRSQAETIALIRQKIAAKDPELFAKIIEVEVGVWHDHLEVFKGSSIDAWIACFPLFELKRKGCRSHWTDVATAVGIIRERIFIAHPKLAADILILEEQLAGRKLPNAQQLKKVRIALFTLTEKDLKSINLEQAYRSKLFTGMDDMLVKAFPLLRLTNCHRYMDQYDLISVPDIRGLLQKFMLFQGVTKPEELQIRAKPGKNAKIKLENGQMITLRRLCRLFATHIIPEIWFNLPQDRLASSQMSEYEALKVVLELGYYRALTRIRLVGEIYRLNLSTTKLTDKEIVTETSLGRKYRSNGRRAVEVVIGMPIDYILTNISVGKAL